MAPWPSAAAKMAPSLGATNTHRSTAHRRPGDDGHPRQWGNRKLGKSAPAGTLYVYPREKSIQRFKEQVRQLTSRRAPVTTQGLIDELNPKLRGWGHYYQRAHVRRLFTQLDAWIVRRFWAHRCKRWRCSGWKRLPKARLYGEMGLVSLLALHLHARPPR
jgi:hypothetical protein